MRKHQKRVFKTKTFAHWAKKAVPGDALCAAALEIEQGLFEADLGQGVCKKRIAVPGQGKSGATRTLVAKRQPLAIFFLFGRKKSDPGSDFPDVVFEISKTFSVNLETHDAAKLDELAAGGEVKEICNAP